MAIIACEKCGSKYSDKSPDGCQNCTPVGRKGLNITCPLCRTGAMEQSTAQLFTDHFVRFCGGIFVVPAFIGIFSAFAYLFSGNGIPFSVRFGVFSGVVVASMISGVAGWIILSKRNVWKCTTCGHYLPRQ
nr:hypothetical protein [uncultured Desulfuromonas sp.]